MNAELTQLRLELEEAVVKFNTRTGSSLKLPNTLDLPTTLRILTRVMRTLGEELPV